MTRRTLHSLSLVAAASLAVLFGEVLTAQPGMADVYRTVHASASSLLAAIVGSPERRPRDLMVNGQPLTFTPYQSNRAVSDITAEWLQVLQADTRPVQAPEGDVSEAQFTSAANIFIQPKVSHIGDNYAVIVRFFDGDGAVARDFLHAQNDAMKGRRSQVPMVQGIAVSIRRLPGSNRTEALMSRFDDVRSTLAAFAAPADSRKLPSSLQPPAGVEVLSDIGDRGDGHISRTIISSGNLSVSAWSDARSNLLGRAGFNVDPPRTGRGGVLALHARHENVEADVIYTRGKDTDKTIEVVEIRQPLIEGNMP
ncbi:hypothetical protein [Rhizobium lusitanum]|uniref:Uncharacterized protein n=1 Tax=Rhizobium lusitanum TaxID=293958 RepID=A0A7X0IWK5_9HYPH|nr:hypothetical protein [Rhizobium lusitanum]MBB6487051.1 hypothetical protein [Rhizobium lusitanum]